MRKSTVRRAARFALATVISVSAASVPTQANAELSVGADSGVDLVLPNIQRVREAATGVTASTRGSAVIDVLASAEQGGSAEGRIRFVPVVVSS